MKNIAIICEYNPMHNGHIHQINKIKEKFPNSSIIALMSGSFVQRGTPAIIDKFDRSEIACINGVDLVIEMPSIISLQSADLFSYHSINILSKLGNIDYISFGIESNEDIFNEIIDFLVKDEEKINNLQKEYIQKGLSYKNSYNKAIKKINDKYYNFITEPNYTLAIQYVLSLKKLNSKIKYLPIYRNDGGYNNKELDLYKFQSASTIRKLISDDKDYMQYVPKDIKRYIDKDNIPTLDDYNNIFIYKSQIEKINPSNIAGYEDGILNLLIKNQSNNLEETISKSKNKRHSISRLQRFILNYLLGITNHDINILDNISYIRPLKFNDKGRYIINKLKDNDSIKILNKINYTKDLDSINNRILDIDKKAYQLRNINNIKMLEKDYTDKPYMNIIKKSTR